MRAQYESLGEREGARQEGREGGGEAGRKRGKGRGRKKEECRWVRVLSTRIFPRRCWTCSCHSSHFLPHSLPPPYHSPIAPLLAALSPLPVHKSCQVLPSGQSVARTVQAWRVGGGRGGRGGVRAGEWEGGREGGLCPSGRREGWMRTNLLRIPSMAIQKEEEREAQESHLRNRENGVREGGRRGDVREGRRGGGREGASQAPIASA